MIINLTLIMKCQLWKYKKLQMYSVNDENKEIYNLHEGKMIRGTAKFGTLVDTIFSTIKPINSYLVNTEFKSGDETKYFSDHLQIVFIN